MSDEEAAPAPAARRPYLRARAGRAEVAARLRAEYEGDRTASAARLGQRHNISRGTVQRLLAEAGTRMRRPAPPSPRPATPAELDAMVDAWLSRRT